MTIIGDWMGTIFYFTVEITNFGFIAKTKIMKYRHDLTSL